jgi:hypothetical protein
MRHDIEQASGAILTFAGREAVRYPLYATISVLLVVIWVILRVRRGALAAEAPVVVSRNGAGLLAAGGLAAGAVWYLLTRHPVPAKVAAVPAPVITQKTIIRNVVHHVTTVTHSGPTGLEIFGMVAVALVIFMVLRLNGKA